MVICYIRRSVIASVVFFATVFVLSRPFGKTGQSLDCRDPFQEQKPLANMADLSARLGALRPTIEALMRTGGTPGLSLAVMHRGEPVFYSAYGHRNIKNQSPIDADTIFPVCSLAKAVTAAAMGVLLQEKKLEWDTLVKTVLPSLKMQDSILQEHMTIADLLSHRTGLEWTDNLIIGTENNVLISGDNLMKFLNHRKRLLPFRGQMSYNNLHYELAGKIIESISKDSFFDFVQQRIFDPLDMTRSSLRPTSPDLDNVSTCYNVLGNSDAVPVPCPKVGNDWYGGPSGGLRSSATDLMKFYKAIIHSFNDQIVKNTTSTPESPLKRLPDLLSSKIPIDQPSRNEISYAFGWARVQLPGRMGQIGLNPGLVPQGMPIVGKGVPSRLLVFHQGSFPGALHFVGLLPDSETVILVNSNALALNDVPDWVGQLALEEILEVPESERIDFVSLAKIATETNLEWYAKLIKDLEKERKGEPGTRNLEDYVGVYWDSIHTFKIRVFLKDAKLYWALQDLDSETFVLNRYEDDTFLWLAPRDELSSRGRWVGYDQGPEFWRARFEQDDSGKISKLFWAHDDGVPAVEYVRSD